MGRAGHYLHIGHRLQGYLAHQLPPPQDHRRALGIGLLKGPEEWQFLMSEVTLYGRVIGGCVVL